MMRCKGEATFDQEAMLAAVCDTLAKIKEGIPKAYEAPEPEVVLDLASRGSNKVREFRHLLQMSTGQMIVLKRVSAMKLAYILDIYVAALERENPLGPTSQLAHCSNYKPS